MSRRPPLPLLLACAAMLSASSLGVRAQSTSAGDAFKGLPVTGELDAQSVLTTRYGQAAQATAPVVPSGSTLSATTGAMHIDAPPSAKAPASAAHAEPAPRSLPARGAAGVPRGFRELGGFTGVAVDSTGAEAQREAPVTFGQVFAPGDFKAGERLAGKLAGGATVPLQVDVKARHADGSVRHAVISALLPALEPHKSMLLALAKDGKAAAPDAAAATQTPKALLDAGFKSCVSATVDGQAWSACADKLLAGKQAASWLAGPVAREWLVDAPLKNDKGAEHPHLAARFAVRWYPAAHKARVDVTLENDWAYEPDPHNIQYDARVTVGDKAVYAKPGLNHLHHARWRKVFWWGEAPALALRYDSAYLDAARAVPHYDPALLPSQGALADLGSHWNGKAVEPMGPGQAMTYMPTTGAHNDIGLLPAWTALYLLSMDPRAAQATMGTADLGGSWPIHYRDKRTGRPVSLLDHPYMTLLGHPGDTLNPATGKQEKFPDCAPHACDSDYAADVAHQPNLAYLPYLLTGDHYYLEELQFWASYDAFSSNPGYRDNVKGLLRSDQVRGQAWGLRTVGEAAYATPDADRLKAYFTSVVKHNLDWYNGEYTDNPAANKLGVIVNGNAIVYNNGVGLAPWQDDFFTASVGHLADLGFKDAGRLLAWKARFPVARMVAPGACWVDAAIYDLTVRTSDKAPLFGSMGEAYKASHPADVQALRCGSPEMAMAFKVRPGSMANLPDAPMGFPSNMQPALAYAADAGGEQGREAWTLFMARSVKPDYSSSPQFAIVPRNVKADGKKD